jgi:lipoprotein-anchoring transpeptidase ErfK/SrfK
MNSVKNLLVVVMLMGVSYGAFQVINTPDPTLAGDVPDVEVLDIQIGSRMGEPSETGVPDRIIMPDTSSGFAAGPNGSMPNFPAPMESPSGNGSKSMKDELDLPELEITEAPPANGPIADNATPPPGNQFQPQPKTELQAVNPKPLSDLASKQLDQATSQFLGEKVQPALDATAKLQEEKNRLSQQANQFMANAQKQLTPPNFSQANTQAPLNSGAGSGMPGSGSTPPSSKPANGEINWSGINELAGSGDFRQALEQLSAWYDAPLPADQRMQMLQWLDQLAGKVIYSTEHHLQSRPYVVAQGDTLESLAAAWNVPPQLIYNINSSKIGDPSMLIPGTELKIVPGPFNARISLDHHELTLFLGDLYAGRFPVEMGMDSEFEHGSFMIQSKTDIGQAYQDKSGQVIAAGAPENPYGKYWLGLANSNLCIHESPNAGDASETRGCIRLSSRDAADVYGILSEGSQVSIMR